MQKNLSFILLTSLLLALNPHIGLGQKCMTSVIRQQNLKKNPQIQNKINSLNKFTEKWIANPDNNNKALKVETLPLVVHVIWRQKEENISDEQIYSQLTVLNEDFRKLNSNISSTPAAFASLASDVELEFCLASRDPFGNETTGITRTETSIDDIGNTDSYYQSNMSGKDSWDPSKYINIWICDIGDDGTLGYAYLPGMADPPEADGMVIAPQYFGNTGTATNSSPNHLGRTVTHEMGHYLNLEHLWGIDQGGCNEDDFVADTPNQFEESTECPNFPLFDDCTPAGDGIMFNNFMDYADDDCMTMFTTGQKMRMLAALNGPRASLLSSNGCAAPTITSLIVTTNADSGTGSLRAAIDAANTDLEPNTITFNIPESEGYEITVSNQLPTLENNGTIIDGTTQPGYDGIPIISINGINTSDANGFTMHGNNCEVSGLRIRHFNIGIFLDSTDNSSITNNFIGDNSFQIEIKNSKSTIVKDNLVIKGTGYYDTDLLNISDSDDLFIEKNFIGTDENQNDFGAIGGIGLRDVNNAIISENIVAFNFNGISSFNSKFIDSYANNFFCNSSAISITNSDDTLYNIVSPPMITEVTSTTISGTASDQGEICLYFQNTDLCPDKSMSCQGNYIGFVTADESGNWEYTHPTDIPEGIVVAASLRLNPMDDLYETSEFSCYKPANSTIVTTNADSGPGSLRAAIEAANANDGFDTVTFNISGFDIHEILVLSPLPALENNGTFIDATTQPSYDGRPQITLNGINTSDANGLTIYGNECEISGLKISNFHKGILLESTENSRISENIISDNFSSIEANNCKTLLISDNTVLRGFYDKPLIEIYTGDGVFIENNQIGTDGSSDDFGSVTGISLHTSNSGTIRGNTIRFNGDGISSFDSKYIQHYENYFSCNTTAVTIYNSDNTIYNIVPPPIITEVASSTISGTATAAGEVCIYFQNTDLCSDKSASCQGNYEDCVTTDEFGNWSWNAPFSLDDIVIAVSLTLNPTAEFFETSGFSCWDCSNDTESPVILIDQTVNNPFTLECGGELPQLQAGVNIFAKDNCDGDITQDIILESQYPINGDGSTGAHLVTIQEYKVTDAAGNTATIEFAIAEYDTQAPVWDDSSLEIILYAECGDDIDAIIAANVPTAQDACLHGNIDQYIVDVYLSSSTSSTGCGNTFQLSLFYAVQDGCGNINPETYKVSIIVTDDTPPSWDTASNELRIELECENNLDLLASANIPNATDACGSSSVILDSVSNAQFCGNYFEIIYNYSASDDCGNTTLEDFQVIYSIPISTGPVISGVPQDITISCNDPYPDTQLLFSNLSAFDVCDGALNISSLDLCSSSFGGCYFNEDGSVNATPSQIEHIYCISAQNSCGLTSEVFFKITIINDIIVDLGPDQTICDGEEILLDAGNPEALYYWRGPNDFFSQEQSPLVSVPGIYTVIVEGQNGCCHSDNITILSGNNPIVNLSADKLTCNISSVSLTLSSDMPGGSYSWNGPNGFTSSEFSPLVTNPGIYSVVYTAESGCSSDASVIVEQDVQIPQITAQGGTFNCNIESIQLVGSSDIDESSFLWTGPNGFFSSEQFPLVFTPGTYNLKVESPNGCGSTTDVIVNFSNEVKPLASFDYTIDELNVNFSDSSSGNPNTWFWDFGDGQTSSDRSPSHKYEQEGEYTVRLEVTNICGSALYELLLVVQTTNIQDIPWLNEVKVFPNPSDGEFNLKVKGDPAEILNITLINTLGQSMYTEELEYNSGKINKNYSFDDLTPGTYYMRLKALDKAYYHKLIVDTGLKKRRDK